MSPQEQTSLKFEYNTTITIKGNAFEDAVCTNSPILFRFLSVNDPIPRLIRHILLGHCIIYYINIWSHGFGMLTVDNAWIEKQSKANLWFKNKTVIKLQNTRLGSASINYGVDNSFVFYVGNTRKIAIKVHLCSFCGDSDTVKISHRVILLFSVQHLLLCHVGVAITFDFLNAIWEVLQRLIILSSFTLPSTLKNGSTTNES